MTTVAAVLGTLGDLAPSQQIMFTPVFHKTVENTAKQDLPKALVSFSCYVPLCGMMSDKQKMLSKYLKDLCNGSSMGSGDMCSRL